MSQQQESIPVGCVPTTCKLYMFFLWPPLGVSTMGSIPGPMAYPPTDFPPTSQTYPPPSRQTHPLLVTLGSHHWKHTHPLLVTLGGHH